MLHVEATQMSCCCLRMITTSSESSAKFQYSDVFKLPNLGHFFFFFELYKLRHKFPFVVVLWFLMLLKVQSEMIPPETFFLIMMPLYYFKYFYYTNMSTKFFWVHVCGKITFDIAEGDNCFSFPNSHIRSEPLYLILVTGGHHIATTTGSKLDSSQWPSFFVFHDKLMWHFT